MLCAEARSWEEAALKIKRKGPAFFRGGVVPEGEATGGLELLFSFLYGGTMPGFGPEPAGRVRAGPGAGAAGGCAPQLLRPSIKDLAV